MQEAAIIQLKWVLWLIPVISIIFSVGGAYAVVKLRLSFHEKQMGLFEKRVEEINKKLDCIPKIKTDIEWIRRFIKLNDK